MEKLEHFRHIRLFEFIRGAKVVEAARNICTMYGGQWLQREQARKWFSHFKKVCFDISNTPRSVRPSEFDEDRLNTLIHNDSRHCT